MMQKDVLKSSKKQPYDESSILNYSSYWCYTTGIMSLLGVLELLDRQ